MADIRGSEGGTFNTLKIRFVQLPIGAKRYISLLFRFAYLQLNKTISRDDAAARAEKAYKRLRWHDCTALEKAAYEAIMDYYGEYM
ncbi:hypothetical protein TELCIR_15372, partial [Teladorsagia circumcincta]